MEVTPSTEVTPSPTPRLRPDTSSKDPVHSDSESVVTKADEKKQPPTGGDGDLEPNPEADDSASSVIAKDTDTASTKSKRKSGTWFSPTGKTRSGSKGSSTTKSIDTKNSSESAKSKDDEGNADEHDRWRTGQGERERQAREGGGWGIGEDAAMGLS